MDKFYLCIMRVWLTAGFLFMMTNCSKVDSAKEEDPLQNVDFAFIQADNKLYFAAEAASSYKGSALDSVNVFWYGTDSTAAADSLRLYDQGENGDILKDDDFYALKVTNDSTVLKNFVSVTDTHAVTFSFRLAYGSTIESQSNSYSMHNSGPSISSVSMPDTMSRPGQDSVSIAIIVVTTADPDGVEDVRTCYLNFYHPADTLSSGSPISLYDDGQIIPSQYRFDDEEGDGKFSRYIAIDSGMPLGIYKAYFYARDYSGILSDAYLKILVVE